MTPNPQSKILVIDTQQYAGNFEREMCAYVTGQVGECGVGAGLAEEYQDTIKYLDWWNEHIVHERDDSDYGCYRPASIFPTIGWFNNGLGGHYKDTPENQQKALEAAIQSMKDYNKPYIEQIKKRIEENNFDPDSKKGGWTKQACERELKQKTIDDIERVSKLAKYPAYMSVAIFVDEFPPQEVWEEFMQRAKYFAQHREELSNSISQKGVIEITGFRQVEPEYKLKNKKKTKVKK